MLLALLILLLPAVLSAQQQWSLAWSDEFNGVAGAAPSETNWTFEKGWGPKDNHEIQWYCEPGSNEGPCERKASNLYLDGKGNLVIRAIHAGQRWTSARINTAPKREIFYGRVEARLRFDPGAGFWPAFWLLGDCPGKIGWPTCGEMDIMEWVQRYDMQTTSSAVHGPGYSGAHGISRRARFPNGASVDDGQFHTYGLTWSRDRIEFYRDDPSKPFFVLTPADLPPGTKWVYDHPFHIILNFAVSETGFGGSIAATTPRTGSMWVDYIRCYKREKR